MGAQHRRPALEALLVLLLASPAGAVFTKSQMDRIDHEPLLDAEYYSDLQGFAYPLAWEELWRASTAPASYRVNAASLDCCELLLDQRARLARELAGGLSFAFALVQDEDKDRRELHHWLMLEQRLPAGFSAWVFGEPAYQKEDADLGFGLGWRGAGWRLRASRLFVDWNLNTRGSGGQRYRREPLTTAFSAGWSGGQDDAEASLELDEPLAREVPAENRLFQYRRTTAAARWRRAWDSGLVSVAEYALELQRKSDFLAPDPLRASSDNARRVHRARAAVETALTPRDRLEAGLGAVARSARTDKAEQPGAGVFYRRWEAQPYARWRRSLSELVETELASFLSFGRNRRSFPGGASADVSETLIEAKVGAGVEWRFRSGRLGLYGTFDADAPGHFWDGGNARAMFFF